MKKIGEFFAVLFFNMLINLEWSIPAWILLAMHFVFGWKLIWFWIALGVWLLSIILWMDVISWASGCSAPGAPRENKNPYSVGQKEKSKDNGN